MCERCWQRPVRTCAGCGARAPTKAFTEIGPLCPDCYGTRRRPRAKCDRCGEVDYIARRRTSEHEQVCYWCYRRPTLVTDCAVCGRERPCVRASDGRRICVACCPKPRRACASCRRVRIVAANWPMGPVCPGCYNKIRRARDRCPGCDEIRPLIARTRRGSPRCGPCAGLLPPPACRTCGSHRTPYARGTCARCVARTRLRDLLAGPDGTVAEQLQPVVDSLTAARDPTRIITWLQSSTSARCLAAIAGTGQHVTHDLLDALPPGANERYIRALLVHAGVLEARDEELERLTPWIERRLAGRPDEHSHLVRPYAHWVLLRNARRRAARGRTRPGSWSTIRARVLLILSFLAWLDAEHLTLATLEQSQLDHWLVSGPRTRHDIRYFLTWAHRRGLTGDHDIPPCPHQAAQRILTEDQRWQELRRCLNDTDLPLRVRGARTLTLLYGMPSSTIRLLTTDDIHYDADGMFLSIGRHPLLVPPRPAALLVELATHASELGHMAGGTARAWLFPGVVPGQPMSAAGFGLLMRRNGFHANPARQAALIALAGRLPSSVLAELLDIHVQTARKWAAYSQPDWAAYLAERIGTATTTRRNTDLAQ